MVDQGLVGTRGVFGQEQISRHALVTVARREADLFLAPIRVGVVRQFHACIERYFVVSIQAAVSRENLIADGFLFGVIPVGAIDWAGEVR